MRKTMYIYTDTKRWDLDVLMKSWRKKKMFAEIQCNYDVGINSYIPINRKSKQPPWFVFSLNRHSHEMFRIWDSLPAIKRNLLQRTQITRQMNMLQPVVRSFSQEIHVWNMKVLFIMIQKLWKMSIFVYGQLQPNPRGDCLYIPTAR